MQNHFSPEEFDNFKHIMHQACIEKSNISEAHWAIFSQKLVIKTFKKGAFLCKKGEIEKYVHFIISGFVYGYLEMGEKEDRVFQFLFAGDFVSSYYSFLLEQPSQLNLVATKDTTTLAFAKKSLETELYPYSLEAARLGRKCAEWLFMIKEKREISFLRKSPFQRYIEMLIDYPLVEIELTQKLVASYLGIVPATIIKFKKENRSTLKWLTILTEKGLIYSDMAHLPRRYAQILAAFPDIEKELTPENFADLFGVSLSEFRAIKQTVVISQQWLSTLESDKELPKEEALEHRITALKLKYKVVFAQMLPCHLAKFLGVDLAVALAVALEILKQD